MPFKLQKREHIGKTVLALLAYFANNGILHY